MEEHFACYVKKEAKRWNRCNHMIGAATILIPRLLLFGAMLLILYIISKFLIIGYDMRKPLHPCRRFIFKLIVNPWIFITSTFCWFTYFRLETITPEQVDHYREYLGEVGQ